MNGIIRPMIKSSKTTNSEAVINRPSGFNWPQSLPLVSAIKAGREFDCSIKPKELIDYSGWPKLYVDPVSGSGGNDGSSWNDAKSSIAQAITQANSNGVPTAIMCKGGVYPRFKSFTTSLQIDIQVDIAFVAVYGRVETGPFESLSWTQNATYSSVYEVARSNAQQVFNTQLLDRNGEQLKYVHVADLATCAATAGSWYTDNVTVYVHTHNQAPANDANARVFLSARNADFTSNNNDIYMYGFDLVGGSGGGFQVRDGSTNNVVLHDCTIKHALVGTQSGGLTEIDGAVILDCGLFAAFGCDASYNSKDGFNLHERNTVKPSGLFVNCTGYENGKVISGTLSANGLTVHDGISCAVIGGEYLGSVGTNFGHVNDNTNVWAVGVTAGQSDGDTVNGGAINWGAFGMWAGTGSMWLDSCVDVGSQIGVYASSDANVYIRNHTGTGSISENVTTY